MSKNIGNRNERKTFSNCIIKFLFLLFTHVINVRVVMLRGFLNNEGQQNGKDNNYHKCDGNVMDKRLCLEKFPQIIHDEYISYLNVSLDR